MHVKLGQIKMELVLPGKYEFFSTFRVYFYCFIHFYARISFLVIVSVFFHIYHWNFSQECEDKGGKKDGDCAKGYGVCCLCK